MMIQKRLAASILKCSYKKIHLDPESLDEIKEAITRIDVKSLIKKGLISKKDTNEISRSRARKIKVQKSKGKRKGPGSRQGKETARLPRKKVWMSTIRAQRALLNKLRENKLITPKAYRDIYSKCKGGFFRSRRHIKLYIEEHNLVKKGK